MTSKAEYIQEADFATLLKADTPVVIDFTASWCGPCKVVGPLMDQLVEEFGAKAKIVKVDVDQNKAIAKEHNIRSIPAVLYLNQGKEVDRVIGVKPYEDFQGILTKLVNG